MTSVLLLLVGFAWHPAAQAAPGSETVDSAVSAQREATRLMNAGLPFAERMLAEHREFAPFGAVMLQTGLIRVVGEGDEREETPPVELYERLTHALREGATDGEYKAVGTFALVELRRPDDGEIVNAVHVALEHRDGYCVDVYYPTMPQGPGLVLGDASAGKRAGSFFDACAESPSE